MTSNPGQRRRCFELLRWVKTDWREVPRQSLSNDGKKEHELNFKQTTGFYLQRLTCLFERTKEWPSFRKVLDYCTGDQRQFTRAVNTGDFSCDFRGDRCGERELWRVFLYSRCHKIARRWHGRFQIALYGSCTGIKVASVSWKHSPGWLLDNKSTRKKTWQSNRVWKAFVYTRFHRIPAVISAAGTPARVWPRLAVKLAARICVLCCSELSRHTSNSTPRAVSFTWSLSITRAKTMIWKAAWAWYNSFSDPRNSSNELSEMPPAFFMAYCWAMLLYANVAKAIPALCRTVSSLLERWWSSSTTRNLVCSARSFWVCGLLRTIFPKVMATSTYKFKIECSPGWTCCALFYLIFAWFEKTCLLDVRINRLIINWWPGWVLIPFSNIE